MKNMRQEKILELIGKYDIETQEELAAKLEECGFSVTQATISRDIRSLKLMKGSSASGGYKYVLPEISLPQQPRFGLALAESIIRVDSAQNLVVIKTYPGMAQPVAACVDTLRSDDIVGCVAGDDSILVVTPDNNAAVGVCEKIRGMLSNI